MVCNFRISYRRQNAGLHRLAGQLIASLVVGLFSLGGFSTSLGDEWITISLPLRAGSFYSLNDFRRQYSERIAHAEFVPGDEREIELTGADKITMQIAATIGVVKIELTDDHLMIQVPNSEDDEVRRQRRRQLESALGVSLVDWPKGKGLHLPDKFDAARPTVLLIHGMNSNLASLSGLSREFARQGIQVCSFDYPSNGPIAWSGNRLSDELKIFASENHGAKIAIAAHSMGGLVARYCLETPDHNPGCVTDLFLLGTPNHGSRLAAASDLYRLICQLSSLGRDMSISDGLSEAAEDVATDSAFLQSLNRHSRPNAIRYHVAIGSKSFLQDEELKDLAHRVDEYLSAHAASKERRVAAAQLLSADELRMGLGDGIVAARSAKLVGVNSEQTFECNHCDLISANDPRGAAVLTWIMHTMNWNPNGDENGKPNNRER